MLQQSEWTIHSRPYKGGHKFIFEANSFSKKKRSERKGHVDVFVMLEFPLVLWSSDGLWFAVVSSSQRINIREGRKSRVTGDVQGETHKNKAKDKKKKSSSCRFLSLQSGKKKKNPYPPYCATWLKMIRRNRNINDCRTKSYVPAVETAKSDAPPPLLPKSGTKTNRIE